MIDLKKVRPEHLWYFVGILATDGNLSKDGRHIILTSKDRDHLYLIQKSLGLTGIIGKKARGGSQHKIYSILQFSDVRFYKYLIEIGFTPKKSLTLGEIKIDKKYFNDFIRGVIDGDGWITEWRHRNNAVTQWALGIVSASPVFINWLKKEIETIFKVKGKSYSYQPKTKKNPLYSIKFGKLAGKVILSNAYYENSLSLERKRLKSVRCLLDKNRMIKYGNVICPGAEIGRQP